MGLVLGAVSARLGLGGGFVGAQEVFSEGLGCF